MNKLSIVAPTLELDFKMLVRQKRQLVNIQSKLKNIHEINAIEGMLNLLDYIQDWAVDKEGYTEKKVFGKSYADTALGDDYEVIASDKPPGYTIQKIN